MFLFQQIFVLLLLSTTYCYADLESDCSAMNGTYYQNGICYVLEEYNKQNLSSSCQSLNTNGMLIDIHTSNALANISTTLYNTTASNDPVALIPMVPLTGYQLKVGDEMRVVGRILPGTQHIDVYWRNPSGDYLIIFTINLITHAVNCMAKVGATFMDYDTTPTTNVTQVVHGEFDIKMKITTNTYEFYFEDVLVHACAQNQSFQDISFMTIWDSGGYLVVDFININGRFYLNQQYFWSGLTRRNGKWFWEKSGLTLPTGYAGWTLGHPTDESEKKCALIYGVTGKLVTADCGQSLKGICQYSPTETRYRFSLDVQNKKVSPSSSVLIEFPMKYHLECLLECGKVPTCKSVSYNNNTDHCLLHDIYSGQDIVDATGYEISNKL